MIAECDEAILEACRSAQVSTGPYHPAAGLAFAAELAFARHAARMGVLS
jgi:hypothetical protein